MDEYIKKSRLELLEDIRKHCANGGELSNDELEKAKEIFVLLFGAVK